MAELVELERREDGVRVVTLNDPDRRNAIGPEMLARLTGALDAAGADPESRALVVMGEGPSFCAGADLPQVFGDASRPVEEIRRRLHEYYRGFLRVLDLPFPTIAAVHGPAVGAGLNLALACDIRLAGPRAKLGVTFTRIGLHPGGGCTFFLVRAMGPQRALRVLLQGDTLDAEAALAGGLVDEIVDDPKPAALDLASRLAGLDPHLARDVKRAVGIAAEHGLEPSLEFESWAQASSATKPQIQRTVERFRPGAGPG